MQFFFGKVTSCIYRKFCGSQNKKVFHRLSNIALLNPRFFKHILKEHSRIDNFSTKKLWIKKDNESVVNV